MATKTMLVRPDGQGWRDFRISESPDFFNQVANHPAVFPAVSYAGQERIDLSEAWGRLIGLEFEGGGFLLEQLEPGYLEVHTLFLPGAEEIRAKAWLALTFIFTHTDAVELVTKVPVDNVKALGLAKAVGFNQRFRRTKAWDRWSGAVDVDYLGMTLDEWIRTDPTLEPVGESLHEMLQAEHEVKHEDDPAHNAYVGAAIFCACAGNLTKGVAIYNRWARFAGYELVEQVSDTAVSFDGVKVELAAEGFRIAKEVV